MVNVNCKRQKFQSSINENQIRSAFIVLFTVRGNRECALTYVRERHTDCPVFQASPKKTLKTFPQLFTKAAKREVEGFVELPSGIFTSAGIWFHTSENLLREFANEVIDRVGIDKILKEAAVWAKSPETVCSVSLIGLLFVTDPASAVALALVIYVLWFVWTPLLVLPGFTTAISFFSSSLLQGALFIVGLSLLGRDGQLLAVGAGLSGFILIRWGVLRRLVAGLSRERQGVLPREDRILRSLLVRYAVSMGITLTSLEPFENRIREIWLRGKQH